MITPRLVLLYVLFVTLLLTVSCRDDIRPTGNWTETTDKTIIENIKNNNKKIPGFFANFYLNESKQRVSFNGVLYFDKKKNNFSIVLKDVLSGASLLTIKKYYQKILIHFHRENKSFIENANTVDLSRYEFYFDLKELMNFLSLEVPLISFTNLFEQKIEDVRFYLLTGNNVKQILEIDTDNSRVKKIEYEKSGINYRFEYLSYLESSQGFYYPELVRITNLNERQRISIKIETITFVNKIANNVFMF